MRAKLILLAYGETGFFAYRSLRKIFDVNAIITPNSENIPNNQLPVETEAKKDNVRIIRTNSNKEIATITKEMKPNAIVISSYNKILPPSVLTQTKCINVHHGDLPRWRGRANFNWAIILGRKSVGLTIHEAIPNLDAGNIYYQHKLNIDKNETIKTLYDKVNLFLEKELATIVMKVLKGYKGKSQVGKPTYCCTRIPNDGLIDWNQKSIVIDRLIRGLTKPFPGAFTYFKNKKMTIWDTEIPKHPRAYEGRIPGRVISLHKGGIEVLTKDSSIIINNITYDGYNKKATEVIRSVKTSLGIDFVDLLENRI